MLTLARLALRLRSIARAGWALAVRYPWQAALVLALAFAAWQWHGKGRALAALEAEQLAHAGQIEAYRAAYARALAEHNALKLAEEARTAAIKDKADAVTPLRRESALAASQRYSDDNRVRECPESDSGPAGGADLSGPAAVAGSAATGREAAAMVAVSRAAVDICTLNSADLQTAVEWAREVWGVE